MKIAIDLGHNVINDNGVAGIRFEDDLIVEVGTKVIYKLKNLKHQVVECRPTWAASKNDSLWRRSLAANVSRADIFASIHFNSFDSCEHGTEVFAINSSSAKIANEVVKSIAALGFVNRGVKYGRHYILRKTEMPSILIKCCFCDNRTDMNLFDPEKMAEAIVCGLF